MPALRHAPAFQIMAGPDPAFGWVMALIGAAAGAALVAAVASQLASTLVPWLLTAALLVPAMAWLAWRGTRHAPLALRWDGQAWWLGEAPVRLLVVMDLGGWLLLRLRATQGWRALLLPRYLALARASCVPQWAGLRATLYSARAAAGPPSETA